MQSDGKAAHVFVDDRTYRVLSVRTGGMGRVWCLELVSAPSGDPVYRHRIAVKTFDFVSDEQAVEHELNAWISLKHRCVVPLRKIGRLNYRLAAIMPLLIGSLDDLIEEHGPFNESEVAKVLLDVVDALDYAWSTFKLLHLDLKPSNVLVENSSPLSAKVSDWGISRLSIDRRQMQSPMDEVPNNHKTAYAAGTPLFMAPERFSGNWILSPRADIYSIGMMAVQLSTGLLPFRFGQENPAVEIATGSYFQNALERLRDHSKRFQRLCLHCIHPDASQRPVAFRELAPALKALIKT